MRGGGWVSIGLCRGTIGLVIGANLEPLDFMPFSIISFILPTATKIQYKYTMLERTETVPGFFKNG